MDESYKISPQVEIWKKIVDVQQHFNDLELRVRNFALIVTGAFLGLGVYAIKDGGMANSAGHHVSAAALIVGPRYCRCSRSISWIAFGITAC
jgi:predicted sugar kinase